MDLSTLAIPVGYVGGQTVFREFRQLGLLTSPTYKENATQFYPPRPSYLSVKNYDSNTRHSNYFSFINHKRSASFILTVELLLQIMNLDILLSWYHVFDRQP